VGDNTQGLSHALADIEDLKESMRSINRRLGVVSDKMEEEPVPAKVNDETVVEIAKQAVDDMNRQGDSMERSVLVGVLQASWTGPQDEPVYSLVVSVAPTSCKNPYRFAESQLEDASKGEPDCAKHYHVTDIREVPFKALRRPAEVYAMGGGGQWYIVYPDGKLPDVAPLPTSVWFDENSSP